MRARLLCSIPGLLEQIVRPPMGGAGLTIYIQVYNSIFFFVFASVLYAAVSHAVDGSHRYSLYLQACLYLPHETQPYAPDCIIGTGIAKIIFCSMLNVGVQALLWCMCLPLINGGLPCRAAV